MVQVGSACVTGMTISVAVAVAMAVWVTHVSQGVVKEFGAGAAEADSAAEPQAAQGPWGGRAGGGWKGAALFFLWLVSIYLYLYIDCER